MQITSRRMKRCAELKEAVVGKGVATGTMWRAAAQIRLWCGSASSRFLGHCWSRLTPIAPLPPTLTNHSIPPLHRCLPLQAGPPRPPPPGFEGSESLAARLHSLLDSFDAAPFTLQRLCEVLLEPRKQYARLDKVVSGCGDCWGCCGCCVW